VTGVTSTGEKRAGIGAARGETPWSKRTYPPDAPRRRPAWMVVLALLVLVPAFLVAGCLSFVRLLVLRMTASQ
jgi:hypothetical protein